MEIVKKFTANELHKRLIGKRVQFTSDCEFFPNFDVTGKVTKVNQRGPEIIIECITTTGRNVTIGSNMKNLKFRIV